MDVTKVHRIREEMERAEARRLQPHYIEFFFLEAFKQLGGNAKQRDRGDMRLPMSPAPIRNRDRLIGFGEPVLPRYERIAFEKSLIAPQGQALAAFVCPGHPLLDAAIDLTLERHRDLLRRGTVLVDDRDPGLSPRVLFFLEHAIQDAGITRSWGPADRIKANALLPRVVHIAGYSLFSLTRASAVVNCQSALVWCLLRLASQAATSSIRVCLSGIRRSRH